MAICPILGVFDLFFDNNTGNTVTFNNDLIASAIFKIGDKAVTASRHGHNKPVLVAALAERLP